MPHSDLPEQCALTLNFPMEIKVSAGWRQFVSEGTKAVSEFFLKSPFDAAVTSISGLISLGSSFSLNRSPGYLLWTLALTGTCWAAGQSTSTDELSRRLVTKLLTEFIKIKRSELQASGVETPIDFLDRPTHLRLYREFRDYLIAGIDPERREGESILAIKMDTSFSIAIFKLITERAEIYAPLVAALDVPASTSASLSKSWTHYRKKLVYDFEVKSLFGQENERISISQLYVPLRGTWDPLGVAADPDDDRRSPTELNIVRIDEYLDQWVSSSDADDWLRLIGGGPGSGKSTTLKALAKRAAEAPDCRPLFVPLQNLDLEKDLREAINTYFVEESDCPFSDPPLSRQSVEDGAPLLLIFDGLDELAAPGEAAKDVVSTFATRLHNLYSSLTGSNQRRIRVVVSGRMPAFQAATRYLPTHPRAAIETHGFLPTPGMFEENELWAEDQRVQWWAQYAKVKGEPAETPEAFSSDRLEGITNEPLLCYLLALAGYANQHWELAADNRNRIYGALIESIYERGWGEGAVKRHGPGRTLSKPDFKKLMETIALAAWLGGDTRVASAEKFEEVVAITDARDAWEAFTRDNGQDIANLAMNFYLKSADKAQRGFEFTHKTSVSISRHELCSR
jgi:hypothetical protein